jgi:hypothetical protein
VVESDDGPIGLFRSTSELRVVQALHPERPVRVVIPGRGALLGMSVAGDDLTLLEYRDHPSVVRITRGVVDERSRLTLPDVGFDVQVIPSGGDTLTLHYGTPTSREIVTVSCR